MLNRPPPPLTEASADAPLDPVAIGRLVELDPTGANRIVEKVLQTFQTSIARLVPQLEAARSENDAKQIRFIAHTIKSSSGVVGAVQLSQLAGRIETAIHLDQETDPAGRAAELLLMIDRALVLVDRLLKERA